ncbi:hypothetical protein DFH08DRAFT_1046584 [Mycena albidolilacea]|uniref:Uncharacterized protein n=1 Tax=Mycena albidolilacea TaxID=1033008 RepID=A0AAD6Z793_9AGAR|nr:hypothetical protein DFH08DRAFT_1046584 [Mycena albidolilacea]
MSNCQCEMKAVEARTAVNPSLAPTSCGSPIMTYKMEESLSAGCHPIGGFKVKPNLRPNLTFNLTSNLGSREPKLGPLSPKLETKLAIKLDVKLDVKSSSCAQLDLQLRGQGGDGGEGIGRGQGGHGGTGQGPTVNFNYGDREEECKKIIDWLSPINFFLQQADISGIRLKETGTWFLENDLFKQWECGSGRTLWCYGICISMVVDHLSAVSRNNEDIGVACIYLNHKEADQQSPLKLLAGIWRQLVLDRDIGSIAENLYKQHREKGTAPSLQEVADILSSSLKKFSQVFIVIDAIDEYPEDQRFILLKHLAEQMGLCLSVNLMVTSRPHIPADPTLPNVETLEIGAMPEDIQKFVNAQIDLSPRLYKHVQRQPKLREDIHSKISSKSVDGMFLLAKLRIDSLSTKTTFREVREALKALPESLYGSYDIAIQRIDAQSNADRKTAHPTITWVANTKRPLTVKELQVALAVKPGMQKLDEEEDLTDIDIILSVCAGLVIVDRESFVVRLVHYTTQEYLDSIQALLFPDAQTEIAHTLLTFLNFDGYPEPSWANPWHGLPLPPLVGYSQYCLAHAAGQSEVQLRKVLLEFLRGAFLWKRELNVWRNSWQWQWNSMPWNYLHWPSQPSVLWISAAANLVDTVKFLLDQAPLQLHSEHPEIIVASYYGHAEIVSFLLEKGADVNAPGGRDGSSLQATAAGGHTEIVGMLLEKGADINAAGGRYGSSLQVAAAGGHTEIVSILLEKGADINIARGEYGTVLEIAKTHGHNMIVPMVLERGARYPAAPLIYSVEMSPRLEYHSEGKRQYWGISL